ncbi:serine/threonine-protein kinase [Simiduia curdlanivorans]|uniref:Serine/threonine-protein kinase n=1 Tax=Simiduia curdlanivorans TaxID=1492769 RepID=A0ABV8UYG4_9GAMM|nr:serine/threonine-protein kinase [Simiduia curdlanivorans]MDN3640357.1 serine/threonine-protein kinase [Simiduia curdlanivorans]
MIFKPFTDICASHLQQLKLLIRKPLVLKMWLLSAHKAQLAAVLVLVFILAGAPSVCGALADALYPPPAQSLGKRIVKVFAPGVSHKHPLRDARYHAFLTACYGLFGIPLWLLFSHLGPSLRAAQAQAETYKNLALIAPNTATKQQHLQSALNYSVTPLPSAPQGQATLMRDTDAEQTQHTTLILPETQHLQATSIGEDQRYQVVKALASGGAGVVYQALDTRLKRQVAIKQLLTHNADNAAMVARFREEAHALANLNHPHIISIFDLLEHNNQLWMVMELMSGGTLADKIRAKGFFSFSDAIILLSDIADGLAAAHSNNIVHRDIKPENILFTEKGVAKIGDFGIAKSAAQITQTQHGLVLGSPGYMSPEQAAGQSTDNRSDIYALGITLYEMLTGELPFTGSTTQVLTKHITQAAPLLSSLRYETPVAVDRLLQKMLEKEPAQRYQNVTELLTAVNTIRSELAPKA